MATTGPGQHRHRDSHSKWTTQPDPPHTHTIDLTQYALNTALGALRVEMTVAINDLRARVRKLEPITFSFTTKP